MRILTSTLVTFLCSTLLASANSVLTTSLTGTTSTGFEFIDVPQSVVYGFAGAAFLVVTVLRRRKHIYRANKQRF